MQHKSFNIKIQAPIYKVWHIMLDKNTYEIWAQAFSKTSTYEGDWKEGSDMRFVSKENNTKEGEISGMLSHVDTNILYNQISLNTIGCIINDKIITEGSDIIDWKNAKEEYFFEMTDNKNTNLRIEVDIPENYLEFFEKAWNESLLKIKELSENNYVNTNKIWLNLGTSDMKKSREFYNAIGFEEIERHKDNPNMAGFKIDDTGTLLMIFTNDQIKNFMKVNELGKNENLVNIGARRKEDVDILIDKVKKAGGVVYAEPEESQGFMYVAGFRDIDGHSWCILYMDYL